MKRFAIPAAALLMAACQDAAAPPAGDLSPPLNESSASSIPIPNRYIVVLRPDVQDVAAIARNIVATHGGSYDRVYTHALKGFAATISETAARAIASHPLVAYVEQDQTVHLIAQQDNPVWGLNRIDQRDLPLDTKYVYNYDGTGVHAYIIDTGIRSTHNEFGGRVGNGTDEVDNDSDPSDCNGHGTHVAGTVGGATYGVAKNVTLHGVRVLDCGGSGTDAGVIAGIDWVTANKIGPAVANMSLGGGFSQALNDAVSNSMAAGVSYGLAAGNGYQNACDGSPASTGDPALTVGATDINDREAVWSDRGPCVDVWAPGVGILSAWSTADDATENISGTSMATPHVVGVAALYRQANPSWTPTDVFNAIKADATPNKVIPNEFFPGIKPPFVPGQNKLLYMGRLNEGAPPPPPTPPAAPSALAATPAGQTQIDLAWTDGSNNEDGFKIERCTGAGCTDFAQIATTGPGVTSYSNTGLSPSTSYSYRVRAYNGGGNSDYSNTSSATTDDPPPPPPAPAAPSGLSADPVGQTQINLAWTDNADNEDGFKIERCTGAGCTDFGQIATVGANTTSYNNTGLSSGTTYSYRVRANNAGGDSDYSNTATATTASPPPDAPPVARYTWSCNAKGGRQCNFNASTSSDDNGITSYSWNFGDGTTGTGVTVTHRYTSSGTRTVTLTVRDNGSPQQTGTRACSVTTGTSGTCAPAP